MANNAIIMVMASDETSQASWFSIISILFCFCFFFKIFLLTCWKLEIIVNEGNLSDSLSLNKG